MELLSKSQLERTMGTLTMEQKEFLENRLSIRRKSQWLQILAYYKGVDISENMSLGEIEDKIDDWILVDCLDGGYKKRPYKCDCGQALRFQYIVQNKKAGEVRKLGEHCFEKYLSLPASVIKDVKSGLYTINLERDEILTNLHKGLYFPLSNYLYLNIPTDIVEQYKVGLPLTDNQIRLIKKINENYEEEKRLSSIFDRLNIKQKAYVSKMSQKDRRELLLSLEIGVIGELIPDEDIPELDKSIKHHLELQLPFLKRQKEMVREFKIIKRREKFLNGLTDEQKKWFVSFSEKEQNEILDRYNETPHYSIQQIKGLPINDEIIKQLQFNFPLLKRHLLEVQFARIKIDESKNNISGISFGLLMNRHLETLRAVREKEKRIPPGLRKDWIKIQELSIDLQNGEGFDYEQFKLLLGNLIILLGIDGDPYL